eukprot:m.231342 g.231342  ORF g.231342 m.231342 type:complete len:81 (+) comp18335_c0_seq1:443-685(+)
MRLMLALGACEVDPGSGLILCVSHKAISSFLFIIPHSCSSSHSLLCFTLNFLIVYIVYFMDFDLDFGNGVGIFGLFCFDN